MKGYSKIKLMSSSTTKSRSMDSSDPTLQNPISIKKSAPTTITQKQPKNNPDHDYDYNRYSGNNQEQDGNFSTEKMTSQGTITDANSTSNLSSRFKIEKQNSTGRTLQTAVKRVVSMRRSSSVSEGYSRFHDQGSKEEEEDDDDGEHVARSKKKMKKRSGGRMLEACKRVFGL